MITRTSLLHPTVRIRICLTMLAVLRGAKQRGSGTRFITPENSGGALRMVVSFDPKAGGWRFLDADGHNVTAAVRDAPQEARDRHGLRRAA